MRVRSGVLGGQDAKASRQRLRIVTLGQIGARRCDDGGKWKQIPRQWFKSDGDPLIADLSLVVRS
ncbi:MAG: hypothetical protein OSA01_04415 [Arenicellales bacterium]|nr:hypothetical protein [Arenicellales bacterium]